ncbi:MAG TPA: hypothetical protein VNZ85_05780 [Caulobacter sp.]|nr:hypothetical protein [Caulobacter sp.]
MSSKKHSAHIRRIRFRLVAAALRNVGAITVGLAGGWMILTLSFRWDLALATMAGLGLVMLSFLLVPCYAEPPE